MDKINKMAKAMNVTLPQNYADILVKDNETALNMFMTRWLPVDQVILKNVVMRLPNPK